MPQAENTHEKQAHRVDARGMRCPLPVLRLRRLAEEVGGGVIELLATDPAARTDVPAFCAQKGWTLESVTEQPDGATLYRVKLG
ncbi:MAG TPA: sulfurtransferase TusA family protein [Pedomonas sp.]|uniref:sulfurtransferase TusA family protein n=1 Tax=Pedomonas sp. TaxID=2976421 RepID=UPI002F4013E6